jgi:hypothetical protein
MSRDEYAAATVDRRPWWRSSLCWWAHSRYAVWNDEGDMCCSRCNVIVWKGAAFSKDYERTYGRH